MQTIHKLLLFGFACLLFLGLCSMMMVFNGASSTEYSIILQLQKALLWPAILYCFFSLVAYLVVFKDKALREIWRRIPGYLIFTLVIVNFLSFSGFLAFYLVQKNLGYLPQTFQLTPLYILISSSFAILLSFSFLKRNAQFSSYMSRLKAREEMFSKKN